MFEEEEAFCQRRDPDPDLGGEVGAGNLVGGCWGLAWFFGCPKVSVQAGKCPGVRASRDCWGGEWWKPCFSVAHYGQSWLPPTVDVSDGWGYTRLPLSLRCIFYKGAGTEQTGFQLVSVFSVVTLSIKFLALTMRRGGKWAHRLGRNSYCLCTRLEKGAWWESRVSCFPNINWICVWQKCD